ncbi:MAG: hypothetical protein AAF447_16630 [Myxococcota bacterium]
MSTKDLQPEVVKTLGHDLADAYFDVGRLRLRALGTSAGLEAALAMREELNAAWVHLARAKRILEAA